MAVESRTGESRDKGMAGHQRDKVIPDEVHQNQIFRELYLKELRTQKLYTQYHVNPLRKGKDPERPERKSPGEAQEPWRPRAPARVPGEQRTASVISVRFHGFRSHDL